MKSRFCRHGDETGFSLMEMMVVIAMIAILAAVAIPGFSAWIPNYRLKSAAQDLYSNFQLAKMTAVKKNTNCTVTFNQFIDGTRYDYAVFVDSNRNLVYDAGDEVVTKRRWEDYNIDDLFNIAEGGGDGLLFGVNDENLPVISFRSNGLPVDNAGNSAGGTVYLKNIKGREINISVSTTGNISIQ